MISEQQAKDWFCKSNCSVCEIGNKDCKPLQEFVRLGKEKKYIKLTTIEQARKDYYSLMNNNCYIIEHNELKHINSEEKIVNPWIILKTDLNRIISKYELAIKELQEQS